MQDRGVNKGSIKHRVIEQVATEWQSVARTGLEECGELIAKGFVGYAGEQYQNRLLEVRSSMERTASILWEGMRV